MGKRTIPAIIIFLGLSSFAQAIGPSWLMSYSEITSIRPEQKSFYMGKILTEIPLVVKTETKESILSASKDEVAWTELRVKIKEICLKSKNDVACKNIQEARVQAIEKGEIR